MVRQWSISKANIMTIEHINNENERQMIQKLDRWLIFTWQIDRSLYRMLVDFLAFDVYRQKMFTSLLYCVVLLFIFSTLVLSSFLSESICLSIQRFRYHSLFDYIHLFLHSRVSIDLFKGNNVYRYSNVV
jgi:hypothetical protein